MRAPLKFPLEPPLDCPVCGCKTVQILKDGSRYCSRTRCRYDSNGEAGPRSVDLRELMAPRTDEASGDS